MLIQVRHTTHYSYDQPASYAVQNLRLTPASFKGQRVLAWKVTAAPDTMQFTDAFGNLVHLAVINTRHQEMVVEAAGTVETANNNGVVAGLPQSVPLRVFLRETERTRCDAAIAALAAGTSGANGLDKLHALSGRIRDKVDYVPGATDVHTNAAAAFADGKGVCQDHAHIFIAAARSLGVPARYVTGYLAMDGPGVAEAHHAWAEAWVEALGWVGFDVANRICPTQAYVRLAVGLDAGYAAPVIGSRRGGRGEKLRVAVEVQQASAQQ
jgi:transglutaminase-like putative cysteine protease